MTKSDNEALALDTSQPVIDEELSRLASRMDKSRENRSWDSEVIERGEEAWIAYLRPSENDGINQNAIYILDMAGGKPAYAVLWCGDQPPTIYCASKYKHRWGMNGGVVRYYGFDIDEGCEWELVTSADDSSVLAELLGSLPA